jgi:hypothetical protein
MTATGPLIAASIQSAKLAVLYVIHFRFADMIR